jgi:hypothetical protein
MDYLRPTLTPIRSVNGTVYRGMGKLFSLFSVQDTIVKCLTDYTINVRMGVSQSWCIGDRILEDILGEKGGKNDVRVCKCSRRKCG